MSTIIKANETVTTLANANGVLTYTNEANVPVVVDIPALVKYNH
ncbi:hypothetical protein [Myroides odoratus]|nr:hypothetical protein [Myroides odoratus]